ncbi:MAG: AtpZ/AtpI family protein [Candidatus Andersenbacteria bacterium]
MSRAQTSRMLLKQALQLGASIALPLLLLLVLGRWLDRMRGTSPLFLLIGLGLSLVLTTVLLTRLVRTATRAAGGTHG